MRTSGATLRLPTSREQASSQTASRSSTMDDVWPAHMGDDVGSRAYASSRSWRVTSWQSTSRSGVKSSRFRIGSTSATSPMTRRTPSTEFPPIEPLRPPEGAPNVLIVLLDDVGFGAASAFGGPANTPTAERLQTRRVVVQPIPHDGALRTHSGSAAQRAQPPFGRHGDDHRDGDRSSRLERRAAEQQGRSRDDAQAERLFDCPVRKMSRGATVAVLARRAVRRVALRWRRVRALLWLHRWREQSVLPGVVRRVLTRRAGEVSRGRLSPHRGPGGPGDRLGPHPEGVGSRQALLHVLRSGRDPRTAPRAGRVGRQVRREVRRRLGRSARSDVRPAEGDRRSGAGRRAHRRVRMRSPRGRTCPTSSSRCSSVRWRSTRDSSSTPTSMSVG